MALTLAQLAQLVGGTLHGDGSIVVERAMPLGVAQPGDITLVDSSDKSKKLAAHCTASAVVIAAGCEVRTVLPAGVGVIETATLHETFTAIVRCFRPERKRRPIGISPQAVVSPTARIAANVDIHPGATIGDDVVIGAGTVIHSGVYVGPGCKIGCDVTAFPNVVLYEDVIVGDRTILHAGAVLGAYGFGYRQVDGRHMLTPQLGYVEIGSDVEIGAGTTIDRGTYGPTVIGDGTKIDNQVMIGHNCRVGKHNLICSQVGLAGSTTTGDYIVMAGQVGIRDHLTIGDRAVLGAKAGIMYDVEPGAVMMGSPAYPMHDWRHQQVIVPKLPEMRKQLKELERAVTELRAQLAAKSSSDPDARSAA